jgi:hypothetical protein
MLTNVYYQDNPFTRQEILKLVGNGQFCAISFIKRTDGNFRVMNCRVGVKRYVSGEGLRFDPVEKDLIQVFDVKKHAYRFVPIEGIVRVNANRCSYRFIPIERIVRVNANHCSYRVS